MFFTPTPTPTASPAPDAEEYNYEDRSNAFKAVKSMPAGPEKTEALKKFIAEETALLQPSGLIRGPLIDAAKHDLYWILHPVSTTFPRRLDVPVPPPAPTSIPCVQFR